VSKPYRLVLNAVLLLASCTFCGCAFVSGSAVSSSRLLPFRKASAAQLSPEFREAQRMFGKNTEKNLLAWAMYQEDTEQYAEAMKTYRELSVAYPDSVQPQLGIARVEEATGRSEQALTVLQNAAAVHPQNVEVQLQLMRLHTSEENWQECLKTCEIVCNLAPTDQNARYEVGIAMVRADRVDDALPHLTFAVGRSAACYNVAWILHEQSRDAEAVPWLQQALSEHPDRQTAERSKLLLTELSPVNPQSKRRHDRVMPAAAVGDQGGVIHAGGPVEVPSWNGPGQGSVRPARHSGPAIPADGQPQR
jgi:tetratricopeptide (TPR) repeat protein